MLKKKLLLMSLTALTTLTGLNINLIQKENIINTNPVHYAQRRMNKAVTGLVINLDNMYGEDIFISELSDLGINRIGDIHNTLYFFILDGGGVRDYFTENYVDDTLEIVKYPDEHGFLIKVSNVTESSFQGTCIFDFLHGHGSYDGRDADSIDARDASAYIIYGPSDLNIEYDENGGNPRFLVNDASEDLTGPYISGSQTTFTTNVDSPISIDTIKSSLSAYDETDGDVSSTISVKSDNYSANKNKVGTYSIVFTAHDNSDNYCELTINVTVQDLVFPVLNGPTTLTRSYKAQMTDSDVLAQYTATDNYDSTVTPYIKSKGSPVKQFTVGSSLYVGYIDYVIAVKDSSNHETTKNLRITYQDDVAPVISGSTSFITNNKTSATINDILTTCNIVATDEACGELAYTTSAESNCFYVEKDTFTGSANKPGTYEVVFAAVDKFDNKSTLKVDVVINDKIAPVFYIDESIIYASNEIKMTNVDIVNLMTETNQLNKSKSYRMSINDKDGYLEACQLEDSVPVGDYEIIATVKYEDGTVEEFNKTISVYSEDDPDVKTVKMNPWESFVQWWKNLFAWCRDYLFKGKASFENFGKVFTEGYVKTIISEVEEVSE